MIKITRLQGNKAVETFQHIKGHTLLSMLRSQGHDLESPCNGQGVCGKCKIQVHSGNDFLWTTEELIGLSNEERANGWRLSCLYQPQEDQVFTWDCNPTWAAQEETFVFLKTAELKNSDVHDDLLKSSDYGIAVDLGTTTIVASLVSLNNGNIIEESFAINPQKQYGLDVMSRIGYQEQSLEASINLKEAVLSCLNNLIESLLHQSQLCPNQISKFTLVGNTPMLHFLLGLSASKLGKAPYLSLLEGAHKTDGASFGLPILGNAEVYLLPPIKGFVGSDISAGIIASDLLLQKGNVLLIDIGTNGEIVLKTDQGLFCCSCAAGPAFEGANISCGMRATAGAIESIEIDIEGSLQLGTIDHRPPIGICGSGVLDAISQLAKSHLIGKNGRLKTPSSVPERFSPLLSEDEFGRYFILDPNNTSLKLYQSDLRQIQLAKGAIRSGIEALLAHQGILQEEISQVLVAGQFGAHIKRESLTGSGMLPSSFKDKVSYIGNSARQGAEICLINETDRKKIEVLINNIQYIELSTLQGYDRLFVNCLNFELNEVSL